MHGFVAFTSALVAYRWKNSHHTVTALSQHSDNMRKLAVDISLIHVNFFSMFQDQVTALVDIHNQYDN